MLSGISADLLAQLCVIQALQYTKYSCGLKP